MSRTHIMKAAIKVFAEKGYHQASMDEIAIIAEVAKGTLYYHFSSKLELFKTAVGEGLQQMKVRIHSDLTANLTLNEQIRRIIRHHLNLFTENCGLAQIVFHELSNGIEGEVLAELKQLRDEYVGYVAGILSEGQKYGIVREMNCQLAATGIIGLVDRCSEYFMSHRSTVSRDDVENFIYMTITSGLFVENDKI